MSTRACIVCLEPLSVSAAADPRNKVHMRCRGDLIKLQPVVCECAKPTVEQFWAGRQCGRCGRPFLADLTPSPQ